MNTARAAHVAPDVDHEMSRPVEVSDLEFNGVGEIPS
jgi:hypothetical protein